MKKANLKVEFHKYKNVGHGFGFGHRYFHRKLDRQCRKILEGTKR